MKLPISLKEKRDELAEKMTSSWAVNLTQEEKDDTYDEYCDVFNAGVKATLNHDAVKGLIETLKAYCEDRCAYQNPCMAKDALQKFSEAFG